MNERELFKIWAPAGKKWVDWVRPVPFVEMKDHSKDYKLAKFEPQPIKFSIENYKDAAIIVDLPGGESVSTGIELAKLGYRPIPIYNGTMEQAGARATVDNQSIGVALAWGATMLSEIEIKDDALPAFLTDSNRLNRYKMEDELFDNSWDVYYQDLPSAEYFLKNGLKKIIIIGDFYAKDLKRIFKGFQKKGMEIYFTDGFEEPKRKRKSFGLWFSMIAKK